MKLSELVAAVPGEVSAITPAGADAEITGISYDSRQVKPGDLFFAITGYQQDGRKFLSDALSNGAAAAVSQHQEQTGSVLCVRAGNVRLAMALMTSAFYGRPASAMTMVAITGTAGKTTSSYLLRSILRSAGHRTGLIGTISYWILDEQRTAPNTTPESLDLQRLLAQMATAGVETVVMEASSHGIELDRVAGIKFKTAVFTNFSQDHLDFHGNMDRYFRAKRKLFDTLPPDSHAVANIDDPRGPEMLEATKAAKWSFGIEARAMVRAEKIKTAVGGSTFTLAGPSGSCDISLALAGKHNVYNALSAGCAALSLGMGLDKVKLGLEAVSSVAGRMERISEGQDYTVIVDYAHTPEELERLLAAVRELGPARLITVFGCGGDRDRTKRPLMGRAVARKSDLSIVTSDNPRTEDPKSIIDDILPGMAGSEHRVIADRRQAIRQAIGLARAGDVVVIAGKGHEDYQIIGRDRIHFDDREEARTALRERLGS